MTLNLRYGVPILAAFLTGCHSAPKYQPAAIELNPPASYTAAPEGSTSPRAGWLNDFDDGVLAGLVQEAQEHNHDLQAAAARVYAAQANARIAGANRWPELSAGFLASRAQRTGSTGFRLTSPINEQFRLNGSYSWELDLWGKLRNRSRGAFAEFQATEAYYEAARLSLAANTAKNWFRATESMLLLRLAEKTLTSFQENLEVLESSYQRGVTSALDVRLTRANVANARSMRDQRLRERDAAARALEVLLGRYPADELELAESLPEVIREVPAGLPSELLRRRPDLLAAERRVASASERLKAAKKNLLPRILLTGSGGYSSGELRDMLDPGQIAWSIASNATQPLLQGGRLRAQIQASQANHAEALSQFSQAALRAFQEVETALSAAGFLRDQAAALRESVNESGLAEDLAWEEYNRGLTGIVTVLESQRRSFNSQSSLIQIMNMRLQNRVDLYLALAGEFEERAQDAQEKNPGAQQRNNS